MLSLCRNTDCAVAVQEYSLCCLCVGIQTVLSVCRNTDCAVAVQEYRLCCLCAGIQTVLSLCRNTDCAIFVQEYRLCYLCAGIQTVLSLCRNTDCAIFVQEYRLCYLCAGIQTVLSLCRNTSGRISWFASIPCGDSTERWEDCDKWRACPGCGCCGYGPAGCLRACPEGGCRRALWGLLLSFWHWPLCLKTVVMPAWGGSILTVVFWCRCVLFWSFHVLLGHLFRQSKV